MRTHKQYINATVCLSSQTALISLFKGVFSRNISTVLTKTVCFNILYLQYEANDMRPAANKCCNTISLLMIFNQDLK